MSNERYPVAHTLTNLYISRCSLSRGSSVSKEYKLSLSGTQILPKVISTSTGKDFIGYAFHVPAAPDAPFDFFMHLGTAIFLSFYLYFFAYGRAVFLSLPSRASRHRSWQISWTAEKQRTQDPETRMACRTIDMSFV